MNFGVPLALWMLVPIGIFALFEAARWISPKKPWPNIGRLWVGHGKLTLKVPASSQRLRWRLWLGLALLVLALAKPRLGHEEQPAYDPSRDVLIAIDLSRSMLARDVRPSRLDHAKLLLQGMLEKLVGVRVGLVPFAGTAFLQLPLSMDNQIITETLTTLSPDNFPRSGTHFTAMLSTALESFGTEESNGRYLLILSDGESSDANWRPLVPKLREQQIHVVAISIGTAAGAVIPAKSGGVIKDASGVEVVSRMKPGILEELARATNGTYVNANSWINLANFLNEFSAGRLSRIPSARDRDQRAERYQWLLVPAILLLLLSYWRELPVRPRAREIRILPNSSMKTKNASPARTLAASAAFAAVLAGVVIPRVGAVDEAETARGLFKRPSSPADAQAILVTKRIESIRRAPAPNGIDYAGLAIDTIGYVETKIRIRERVPLAVIEDALIGIQLARAQRSDAGDWNKLQSDLERLLEVAKLPPKSYPSAPPAKSDLEVLLAQAEKNAEDRARDQRRKDEQSEEDIPEDLVDKPRRPVNAAFGDMKPTEPAKPGDRPSSDELAASNEQEVGGGKDFNEEEVQKHPDLALPLHRLAQIRNQDSPARLFQLMEGGSLPSPAAGEDW